MVGHQITPRRPYLPLLGGQAPRRATPSLDPRAAFFLPLAQPNFAAYTDCAIGVPNRGTVLATSTLVLGEEFLRDGTAL